MRITRQNRQTLFDVVIIYCGSVEAVFEIARLNDVSLTNTDKMELEVPPVYEKKVVEYYRLNGLSPATAPQLEDEAMTDSNGNTITDSNNNPIITI